MAAAAATAAELVGSINGDDDDDGDTCSNEVMPSPPIVVRGEVQCSGGCRTEITMAAAAAAAVRVPKIRQ